MFNNIHTNGGANEIDFSVNSFIFLDCWDEELLQSQAHALSSAVNSKLVSFVVEQALGRV